MQGTKKWSIGLAIALLLSAVGLVTYGALQPLENHFEGSVRDLLPQPPPGWTVTERPIADSPEMRQAVGELLNFDDAVFVDYTSTLGDRLSVYVAYWKAGKMSSRLVAGHTPDVCWVNSGWKRLAGSQVSQWGVQTYLIPQAEVRVYAAEGEVEHVMFWHLFGGEPLSYDTTGSPPWFAPVSDMLSKGLRQRQEQFFIRLSAEDSLHDPGLAPILEPILAHVQNLAASERSAAER